MTNALFTGLEWLPSPPADFTARCRALGTSPTPAGEAVRTLARHRLDENALNRLAKAMARMRADGGSLAPLAPFRLGLVSNATSHPLVPALEATAARHGIDLSCIEANYDQVMQEALSPDSLVNSARPDAVLVAIDYRGLPLRPTPGDAAAAEQTVAACIGHLEAIRTGLRTHGGAIVIMQTLARPVEASFGSLDLALPGTQRWLIEAVNRRIAEMVQHSPDLVLDVAGMAETVGLADWHDPTLWNIAKFPFAPKFLPLLAEHACRIVAALRGKSRKCLVLDLDNTLWGGVIGDDGVDGIVIGQGDPTGEAHLAVQQAALDLRARGVVLAVSSKNNDDVARTPFRDHPEMLLREDHVAVFQANWSDKATNIQTIADTLALGIDSLVFLDDNPMERGLVREMLPQVAVPELPADPALYARTLLAGGYFEAIAYSAEDSVRADMYQDNARRVALQAQVGDLDAYLASLAMVITFQPFDDTGRARIAQLINKSNQFNLTTRRYTEADVEAAQNDPACFTLQVRLADTFGDNGMISVIICRQEGNAWDIDTWLMSCRVLGRKVETTVLQELARHARASGIAVLRGTYRPTERNALVKDHYAKLGFSCSGTDADGTTRWSLDVGTVADETVPMTVNRIGWPALAA